MKEVKTLVLLNHDIQQEFSTPRINREPSLKVAHANSYKIIHLITEALDVKSSIVLEEDAQYEHWLINLSPAKVNYDLQVNLSGKRAQARLRGIFLGQQQAQLSHKVYMNHQADHTATDIRVHGIADERSKVAFDGIIYVKKNTKGVDAHELLKNLLLSNQAEIIAKPILEIYSHEVACTHGASIGDLDADALFYLASRGFSEAEAKAILLKGFATQFLPELANDALQNWIELMILTQLGNRSSL